MTPGEAEAFILLAKKHKLQALKVPGLELLLSPLAFVESTKARPSSKKDQDEQAEQEAVEAEGLLYQSAEV